MSSKLPLPMGQIAPTWYMDPWAHPTPNPKWHLDWFSYFCRAHSTDHATSVTTGYSSTLRACNTHTQPFNSPLTRTTRVSRYKKGKTNLDFTEARDSEWQWHQLGHMQVCTLLQTDNHASTPPLSSLQAGYPSCHPTNSIKALKAVLCACHAA